MAGLGTMLGLCGDTRTRPLAPQPPRAAHSMSHLATTHPSCGRPTGICCFHALAPPTQRSPAPAAHPELPFGASVSTRLCAERTDASLLLSCFHRVLRLVIFAAGTCSASRRNLENAIPSGTAPAHGEGCGHAEALRGVRQPAPRARHEGKAPKSLGPKSTQVEEPSTWLLFALTRGPAAGFLLHDTRRGSAHPGV